MHVDLAVMMVCNKLVPTKHQSPVYRQVRSGVELWNSTCDIMLPLKKFQSFWISDFRIRDAQPVSPNSNLCKIKSVRNLLTECKDSM